MNTFNSLVVEITRKCNMECDHCLRGCAQQENISNKTIDTLLNNTEAIYDITFTGGEPLLNPEGLKYFINEIIRRGISVSSFFIAHNGTIWNEEIYMLLVKFYLYCLDCSGDEFYGGFACSADGFHDYDPGIVKKWKTLKFYSDIKEQLTHSHTLVNEGLANINGLGTRELILSDELPTEIDDNLNKYYEELVYVNVNGEVLNDCDMSYETQSFNVLKTVEEL